MYHCFCSRYKFIPNVLSTDVLLEYTFCYSIQILGIVYCIVYHIIASNVNII